MSFKYTTLAFILSSVITLPTLAQVNNYIDNAISHPERDLRSVERDAKRKPSDILSILDVKPGDTVIDISSGRGYYTELLSRIVGDDGTVISHNTPYVISTFGGFFTDDEKGWPSKFRSPQWKKNVTKSVHELDTMQFPIGLDGALMVLFYHDTVWQSVNRGLMNQHIFNALKPGGSFVIVDHSAVKGAKDRDVKSLHRIDKQFVIDEVTKAGFVLSLDSNVLANENDTRDFNVFRDVMTNRDSTDRFVLKFVKPLPDH